MLPQVSKAHAKAMNHRRLLFGPTIQQVYLGLSDDVQVQISQVRQPLSFKA